MAVTFELFILAASRLTCVSMHYAYAYGVLRQSQNFTFGSQIYFHIYAYSL